MKRLRLIFIPLLALISCRSITQPEKIVTHVERTTEIRWDTAYIEIPPQSAERVANDSVSHLETDFAVSDARINPDGTLFHNLLNKPQERPVAVPTAILRIDSIVEREVPVYKDKPPNKLDQFKLDSFWWLVGALAVVGCVCFRKPLLKIVGVFLK